MGRVRVLLVDDSEDLRLLYRVVFEAHSSFDVCGEASNGEEAIALAATCCPDAIVLDILMPVMDGMTALPILRELCPTVPIVVMGAASMPGWRHVAMGLGACAVLVKGAAPDQLTRTLTDACGLQGGSHEFVKADAT